MRQLLQMLYKFVPEFAGKKFSPSLIAPHGWQGRCQPRERLPLHTFSCHPEIKSNTLRSLAGDLHDWLRNRTVLLANICLTNSQGAPNVVAAFINRAAQVLCPRMRCQRPLNLDSAGQESNYA
jgi:hypothetical protein